MVVTKISVLWEREGSRVVERVFCPPLKKIEVKTRERLSHSSIKFDTPGVGVLDLNEQPVSHTI